FDRELKGELKALAGNPWEFLYVPSGNGGGFFAASEEATLSITRIIPPKVPVRTPGSPLKLWIVWAAPEDLGKIDDPDLIIKTITDKLSQRGAVKTHVLKNATWSTLQTELNMAGDNKPDILHFIGHGDLKDGRSVIALKRDPDDMARERAKSKEY